MIHLMILTISNKRIIVFLVIVGMTVLVPPGMTGRAYSVFPGTNTNCTDFRLGQLTDTIDAIVTLGIVDLLGDVDITDEGWVWADPDPNERFKNVSGVAKDPHMTHRDLSANHNSHDQVVDIVVDPEYLDLVSDVNADHSGNDNIADSIEMEWEGGIDPRTREEGIEDPNPYFPKWAWPSEGDRVWTNGDWVFDCGHDDKIEGHFPTEIHPARAIASTRDQLFILPGTGTTPVRGNATDLYIHGQSGYMVAQLNCGMNIIFADDPDGCADN